MKFVFLAALLAVGLCWGCSGGDTAADNAPPKNVQPASVNMRPKSANPENKVGSMKLHYHLGGQTLQAGSKG